MTLPRFPLIPTIVVALAITAMIALGVWQLQRRDEKNAALALYAQNMSKPDIAFPRLRKGGEVVLAGFYDRLSFAFPPAFMREARLRISAEFTPADIAAAIALIDVGLLDLDGLISHARPAAQAEDAYPQAFTDPACLKMVLDWREM